MCFMKRYKKFDFLYVIFLKIHRTRKCIDDSHDFRDLPVVLLTGVSVRVTVRQNMPPPGPPQYYSPQGPPTYQPGVGPGNYGPTPPPPYPGNNC